MLTTEQEAKQIGMDLSARNNAYVLQKFREYARFIANTQGEVDIDDVRAHAILWGLCYSSGAWLSSVFKGDDWEWTGKVKASTHKGSHGRMVKIWKRREI